MTQHDFCSRFGTVAAVFALGASALAQQEPKGLALPGTSVVEDAVRLPSPDSVHFGGLLGDRYDASVENRLLTINEDELLAGYRHRPGIQSWVGEHVGKWLHAASLTYMHSHDPRMLKKLTRVATELLKCQEPDGYLGTYIKSERFGLFTNADWDVWSHKYCILGLLAYYQATGDRRALDGAVKAGDLLVSTFGPGGKNINDAGTHQGLASTSVLEPIVLLYRATADSRYLEFAKSIVANYDAPGGPRVVSDLLAEKPVTAVADAKAYEMLSNLSGLLELYRVTGDKKLLDAVTDAWKDIAANRLYITGTGSSREVWTADGVMPNDQSANVGETCVTVSWEQLNLHLLRLTGSGKYADQIERSVYNHLLAAQAPDGAAWCYYTPLNGRKYAGSDTTCCLSSGPRGIALLPTFAYTLGPDGIDVNLYGPSAANVRTAKGPVRIAQNGRYPFDGKVEVKIVDAPVEALDLRLRIPAWAEGTKAKLNGKPAAIDVVDGYWKLRRTWKAGDKVSLEFPVTPHAVAGSGSNQGLVAIEAGPVVMAVDASHNPEVKRLRFVGLDADMQLRPAKGATTEEGERFSAAGYWIEPRTGERHLVPLTLVPFFAAGPGTSPYQVWVLGSQAKVNLPANESLFAYGEESASRVGNQTGAFSDGDAATRSVTYDGDRADEDWYAVELNTPVSVARVVYRHGACYHDGGWFDTSSGKPRIQVRLTPNGPWKDVATLDSYPDTDGKTMPTLAEGQAFEVRFAPVSTYGIRIVGKPSHGDGPSQAFSSCAELQAFGQ